MHSQQNGDRNIQHEYVWCRVTDSYVFAGLRIILNVPDSKLESKNVTADINATASFELKLRLQKGTTGMGQNSGYGQYPQELVS